MSDQELVQLQHERDRGPGEVIRVNGTTYELDEEGCIEAKPADATKLQLGAKWRLKSYWDARRDQIAAATPPVDAGGARRVRTRKELLAMADVNGIPLEEAEKSIDEAKAIEEKDPEAVQVVIDQKAKAEAELKGEDTITVSDEMTKAELLSLGADVGLKLNKAMSKAQILEAFEEAEE